MRKCQPAVFLMAVAIAAYCYVSIGAASWVNVTGNLAYQPTECGNMSLVSAKPGSDMVIAGVALRGLWVNRGGSTWTALGSGSGSDTITNRPSSIVYDRSNPAVFWESGIYNSGGIYKTTDTGTTFKQQGSVWHNDYVSVDMTDPSRQTLLAGGHEQSRTVYKSIDGGQTWTNIGENLPANTRHSSHPLALDALTYVVNVSGWGGDVSGIFRTTNGGASWQLVNSNGPVGAPLVARNGTIYWSAGGGLLKSLNLGATWTFVGSNLYWMSPVELPDGRLATARGSSLVLSSDGGVSWTPVGDPLPYTPTGLTYSAGQGAFFIWKMDCGSVVPPDAIMRLDFGAPAAAAPAPPTNLRIVRGVN
jgi:photosystem II stability/assembly factor-like uncharacterized protein